MIIEEKETIEKFLELQKLEAEIELVLRKHKKDLKHCCFSVYFNKELGLRLESKIGQLMALGYYLKSKE